MGVKAMLTVWAVATAAAAVQGQDIETRRGPDAVDVVSTRAIREATTDPSYLTPWVDYVPQSETVPSPRDVLGYAVGTPGQLTRPDTINDYFRRLAQASDRVMVFSMGRSHGGREMIIAAIADAPVLARLDEIKAANRALADPRRTDREAALRLAGSIPATYWLTAGLHSPETGPPEMVMELAYRLAVSEQEHIREIRANVLTLISPVLEMDGRARMVDWYERFLTNVTDLEESPPSMAPYWGDYTAHDNNRDGLQLSQPLTRNYTDTYHEFLPTVSLDLHESVPLLYASMGTGPYNDTIDPITITEWQWLSSSDVSQATRLGLRGVWTWGFYTGWYPGYLLWVTNNHNAVGRFYETFGNSNPGTFTRDLKHATYAEKRLNSRQWYRPWPPEKELTWSLRNNTNYMQTGVLAALQLAARNSDTLLINFWQKGYNSLTKGRTEAPYAFVVPRDQRDRGNLAHLLWLLKQHRLEVHQASYTAALSDDVTVHEGDYVVRMDQPYRNFAKTLLLKQDFPKTAELSPYDDIAWSLDYMLGVEIKPVNEKGILDVAMTPARTDPDLAGTVEGDGPWLIDHRAQTSLAGLRWALDSNARVRALAAEWDNHPAGSLLVDGISRETAGELAAAYSIDFAALNGTPDVQMIDVDLPRVAIYHTWRYTQDSGWARYAFEQLGLPYTLLNKDDLRENGLTDRFDVIIVPDQGRLRFKDIVHGIDPKWGPMPYTTTPEFPSHGVIDSSPDITGGMGFGGLANLQEFVEDGGLLITLGSAGRLVADGGITREVTSRPPGGTPGSHVTTKVLRPEHPVTWGFDETSWVFHGNEPGFTVHEHWQGMVVMQYGTQTMAEAERAADRKAAIPTNGETDCDDDDDDNSGKSDKPPLCLSGLVKDPDTLQRKPAILDVPVGRGHVLIYSWNPLHRYQNLHDFPFLTNALLFYNDFPPTPTEQEMRRREAIPTAE